VSQDLPRPTGPVVGFDLDMTLIDTAPGFGEVLRVLGACAAAGVVLGLLGAPV
jgi:FMN phosphatase YigB (HAD superfamily)